MKGPDPNDERHHKMEDLVAEIKEAIDELSNLKSFDQLQMEANRAKERSLEVEKKTKVNAYRMEQAECRMRKIEEDEKDRCRKTAEILKDFERKSCNGPFFQSLLAILTNFQGN